MRLLICFLLAAIGWTQTGMMRVQRRAAAVFSPDQLSGMQVWYAADSGLTCTGGCAGSNPVTAWADKSSNHNDLTSGCFAYNPGTYVASAINSLPGVSFGFSCFSFGTPLAFGTGQTIFAVMRNASSGSRGTMVDGGSGSFTWYTCESSKQQGADKSILVQLGLGTAACDTSWHQLNVSYDGSALAVRLGSASDGGATNAQTISTTQSWIGTANAGVNPLNGSIAEYISYSRALNLTEKGQVESYLFARYGI